MTATAAPAPTRPRETAYLLLCHDAPGSAAPRNSHLARHLAYIEQHHERYLVAGPCIDDAGHVSASVLVVRADSEPSARALVEGDPYFLAGVWGEVVATRFKAVCGSAVGGITWAPVSSASAAPRESA